MEKFQFTTKMLFPGGTAGAVAYGVGISTVQKLLRLQTNTGKFLRDGLYLIF